MIASSLTDVLNVKVPGAVLGERLFTSARSWTSSTVASVVDRSERFAALVLKSVVPVVEPLPLRAVDALAWVNGRVLDGFDCIGTNAAASLSFVDQEFRGLRDRTRSAFDSSIHAGLQRLGVPTQQEFTALSRRMDTISATVERLKHEIDRRKATAARSSRRTPK